MFHPYYVLGSTQVRSVATPTAIPTTPTSMTTPIRTQRFVARQKSPLSVGSQAIKLVSSSTGTPQLITIGGAGTKTVMTSVSASNILSQASPVCIAIIMSSLTFCNRFTFDHKAPS